ncbi:unnamed protein product, partial [Rotaria sp. Silwood2]
KIFEVNVFGVVYCIPYNRPRPTAFQNQVNFRLAVFCGIWYNNRSNLIFICGRTNSATCVQYLQGAFNSHLRWLKESHFIHVHPTWAHTAASPT